MKDADSKVPVASDPRLAAHAGSALPAWLWSADGTRILWANAAGVDAFGARDESQLRGRVFGPADAHRRQVVQLAIQLNPDGSVRMERLRGFGAPPGALATCGCSRIDFTDGREGVLVVSSARIARTTKPQAITAPPPGPARDDASQLWAKTSASIAGDEKAVQSNEAPAALPNPPLPAPDTLENASGGTAEIAAASEKSLSPALNGPVDTTPDILVQVPSHQPAESSPAEPLHNVLPFRPAGETKPPPLTAVENSAFDELARRLSARLDNADSGDAMAPADADLSEIVSEPQPASAPPASESPDWLAPPEPPARGQSRRHKALLDLLPAGVLIYRLDRLIYANPAFLNRIGHASLQALEEAGGLDVLFVEPGVSSSSSTSESGTAVTISVDHAKKGSEPTATAARLHAISWDDEDAMALICSEGPVDAAPVPAPSGAPEAAVQAATAVAGQTDAEELGAILDTTAEGIVMFDEGGNITACNRSAEALFGYEGQEFLKRNLADLFAPESQPGVIEYFSGVKSAGVASLLDHGRETLGRVRQGGFLPLSITIGRTRADGPNFFAVFRDLSQSRKSESQLQQARRLTERAASAKSDMLARISHELRAPLNAIIGFAEVMIGERFGSLGNERYVEYMKDIRSSGQRVISVIDDLLDLAKVEAGRIDLSFASQNLNEMIESCVAVLQPHANRERIIIRTSLAHTLPPVVADGRALRQMTMNLIGTSIHLAKAGGQVIVSTALTDFGDVALRIRDTGPAMNDNEVAAVLEPFGMRGPSDRLPDASAVSLSLTKALAEANRAQFHIRPGPHTGTLVEVVFPQAVVRS